MQFNKFYYCYYYYFQGTNELILTFKWNCRRSRIPITTLKKKKIVRFILSNIKIIKAIVIKTV